MTDNSRFPGLLVSKEWVEKLDKERIPNIANLIEAQRSPPFDPDRSYSLPWAVGDHRHRDEPEGERRRHRHDDPASCSKTRS